MEENALWKAAREVDTRGWGRGKQMDDDGRVCLVGALGCAFGLSEEVLRAGGAISLLYNYSPEVITLAKTLVEHYPKVRPELAEDMPPFTQVWQINDSAGAPGLGIQNQQEAVAMLEKAAVTLDEQI